MAAAAAAQAQAQNARARASYQSRASEGISLET